VLTILALKHHTSKLSSFEDLGTILTFGFRGEALSSLCALCESVTVATCTGGSDQAFMLQFANDGRIKSKTRVARQVSNRVPLFQVLKDHVLLAWDDSDIHEFVPPSARTSP
jgi:DNA mismatch repair protein PMS2